MSLLEASIEPFSESVWRVALFLFLILFSLSIGCGHTPMYIVSRLRRKEKSGRQLSFADLSENYPGKDLDELFYLKFNESWENEFKSAREASSLFQATWLVWRRKIFVLISLNLATHLAHVGGIFFIEKFLSNLQSSLRSVNHTECIEDDRGTKISHTPWLLLGFAGLLMFRCFVNGSLKLTTASVRRQILYSYTRVIYSKCLCLSPKSRSSIANGRIQSLLSSDCGFLISDVEKLLNSSSFLLIQVTTSSIALWNLVGFAFLPSFIVFGLTNYATNMITNICQIYKKKEKIVKDRRVAITAEAVGAMEVIKALGFRDVVIKWVNKERDEEMSLNWTTTFWELCRSFILFSRIHFAEFGTVIIYFYMGNEMNLSVAFSTAAWLERVGKSSAQWEHCRQFFLSASSSLERIREFLVSEEAVDKVHCNNQLNAKQDPTVAAEFSNVTLSRFVKLEQHGVTKELMQDILTGIGPFVSGCKSGLKINAGKLTVVIGNVSSGKSTFVSALTRGDVEIGGGSVFVKDEKGVGFASQQPWLASGTLRSNILLGLPFDKKRYISVLDACALYEDIILFKNKDSIIIQENGSNLSGGQQARLAMARAAYHSYSRNQLAVFDDTLSALDNVTSKQIFTRLLSSTDGILKKVTRLLVTNDKQILREADNVIYIKEGTVKYSGLVHDLNKHFPQDAFIQSMLHYDTSTSKTVEDNVTAKPDIHACYNREKMLLVDDDNHILDENCNKSAENNSYPVSGNKVGLKTFQRYFDQMGPCSFPLICGLMFLQAVLVVAKSSWLAGWAELGIDVKNSNLIITAGSEYCSAQSEGPVNLRDLFSNICMMPVLEEYEINQELQVNAVQLINKARKRNWHYFSIYALLIVAFVAVTFVMIAATQIGAYIASKRVHTRLVESVFAAPMDFFWKENSGDIMSRFTSDIAAVHERIPFLISAVVYLARHMTSCTLRILIYMPILLVLIVPFAICVGGFTKYCRNIQRDLKRIQESQSAPLYLHFSEMLKGCHTIKAFRSEKHFSKSCSYLATKKNRADYYNVAFECFYESMISLLSSTVVIGCTYFITLMEKSDHIDPGLAAALLTYILDTIDAIVYLIQTLSTLDLAMINAERVFEYMDITPENSRIRTVNIRNNTNTNTSTITKTNMKKDMVVDNCPSYGIVEMRNVKVKYNESQGVVLGTNESGISLVINMGERVAFVGRTGSGKSSVFRALLRLVDVSQGNIFIDGVDISTLSPETTRKRISCVTQSPIIFSATVRKNLDPCQKHTDAEIWQVLDQIGMRKTFEEIGSGLDTAIGNNAGAAYKLSQGERQLMAFARALLRVMEVDAPIMMLDEATACLDLHSESLIQNKIFHHTKNLTLLSITHRTTAIQQYDRIYVLSDGRLVETGSPKSLISEPKSIFHSLYHAGPMSTR